MYIRHADRTDFAEILECARAFWNSLPQSKTVAFCSRSSIATLNDMLAQEMLFVAEEDMVVVGTLGGVVGPMFMNAGKLQGSEVFFWVDPEHRGSGAGRGLIRAAEHAAKIRGAVYWNMVTLEGVGTEAVASMYLRDGYTATERAFTKKL